MSEFKSTAVVLRAFVTGGVFLMALGLVINNYDILEVGVFILICAPIAGVIAADITFIKSKDWGWAEVTAVLILIIIAGVVIAII